ncbi:cysteine-rich receptor-like protein kinase 25 [Hevea brasiliensis]|uniref:cysteine-rich receptor-like protein kinase 25 n=1 Tax=Hevea brasiliensis TaxID=3981 RepID=UPI0025D29996|nr:cysteine-rich receptor-like protein kinase 25 [Hevea brasiliensis]
MSSSPLSSNSTLSSGFYNTSTGQNPDNVYGLYLCRGDLSADVCKDCVTLATRDIVQLCLTQKEDEYLLRNSNEFIFSSMAKEPVVYLWNSQNITVQERFEEPLMITIDDTASQAANASSRAKKFAISEFYIASKALHTYAVAISRLPNCRIGKQGGRVLFPSCNIRYEIYEFDNATGAVPSPPSPSGATRPQDNNEKNSARIIAKPGAAVSMVTSYMAQNIKFGGSPLTETLDSMEIVNLKAKRESSQR